ncbi:hypothetical protein NE683_18790 [Bariatricus massiliensis]|uniref:Uncharacterized protein n=1 Tax=Bariatricus massiliensis TaxID=1745713 RepID=A0ABS8DN28_9FIRM|nr:hypothetical protein [Bariatricus massiliensis]MCB7306086.1 hypothetical protein [Bariatricus massiliensis]MCB7376545.1 hypothetical protein [Bariatricus massiliensis]MCB7389229.1 hypothetical protein [Bariatricus massiliensis]MCB7413402.1 hypothetical protein [Bariatricus massiliensis]MCQ5255270.1 hypothetical protein [Bariatricus massiliensis]
MSHFLFGEYRKGQSNDVENYWDKNNVIFTFDNKIDFYPDIFTMVEENTTLTNRRVFCLTSNLQMKNSDDLIFPYDKYTNEELFPHGKDRSIYANFCKQNLAILAESLENFMKDVKPNSLRIYVVDGYDSNFRIVKCKLKDMIDDIYNQVINSFVLESKIYEIF